MTCVTNSKTWPLYHVCRRMKTCRRTLVLAALLIAPVIILGQDRAESKGVYLTDDSDWWSILNPQHKNPSRKPSSQVVAATNLRILGLSPLGHDHVNWLEEKLGKANMVIRGDAGTARTQYCYVSTGPEKLYLISEMGEVDLGFYLFSDGKDWNGSQNCIPSTFVNKRLVTESGLKLGLTRSQVIRILGAPSSETADTFVYRFEIEVPTQHEELQKFLAENPSYQPENIAKNFPERYGLSVEITARFTKGLLTYLAVDKSEVD